MSERKILADASAVMPAVAISPGRRCEVRMDYRDMCSYEVLESIGEESVIIRQGEAFALNWSTKGMLLSHGPGSSRQAADRGAHPPTPDGGGPRMSLKSDGPGPFRWSHSEICIWLDANGYLAADTICRSSRTGQGHCRASGVGD